VSSRIEPSLGPPGRPSPPRESPRSGREPPPPPRDRRRRQRDTEDFITLIPRLLLSMIFGAALLVLAVIGALRWVPPPTSSYMLQSPTKPVQYRWVPRSAIAEVMRRAVVASEDQKFWTHHGFDMEAIQKAEEYNKNPRHRRRGASTISQQTSKNLFLWPEGGYFRKGIEAGITVLIEQMWNKDRILEMYLNIAEFGPGIYGVEAASEAFFHKPASQLDAGEAARLAAVLPNPRKWNAKAPGPYVQTRADWIMGQIGYGSHQAPTEEPEPPAVGDESGGDDEEPAPEPPADSSAPASPPPS
jgi:monofunctional glycosyltransferase